MLLWPSPVTRLKFVYDRFPFSFFVLTIIPMPMKKGWNLSKACCVSNVYFSANDCEICILAGGLSSRMGRDKGRLKLGRRSLMSHIREAATSLDLPVRIIRRDLVPRCGPLGGVLTALMTSESQSVLFLSCDMPFITGSLLTRVLAALSPNVRSVFVRSSDGVGFPFLIRVSARPCIERRIAARKLSLQSLAKALRSKIVSGGCSDQTALLNINTTQELTTARQIWNKRQ